MKKMTPKELVKIGVQSGQYPEFLYKYRTLETAIQYLEEPTIYASSILKFNDPFEGHFCLNPRNTFVELMGYFTKIAPTMSMQQKIILAQTLSANPQKEYELLEPNIRKDLEKTGVFCLSRDWNSILSWAYYSEDHKGICIEYKPILDEELCRHLLPVNYSDEYVEFNYINEPEGVTKVITQKAKCWQPENEIRVIKPGRANKIIPIHPKAVTAIILGCRFEESIINNEDRKQKLGDLIKKISKSKYKHLEIRKCKQRDNRYELYTERVSLEYLKELFDKEN